MDRFKCTSVKSIFAKLHLWRCFNSHTTILWNKILVIVTNCRKFAFWRDAVLLTQPKKHMCDSICVSWRLNIVLAKVIKPIIADSSAFLFQRPLGWYVPYGSIAALHLHLSRLWTMLCAPCIWSAVYAVPFSTVLPLSAQLCWWYADTSLSYKNRRWKLAQG